MTDDFLWRKQVMPFGGIDYKDRYVAFTREYLDSIATAFAGGAVREITIPFADRESAELALREVQSFVRPVHDAGGDDYRAVVAGEVVQTDCLCLPPERESRAMMSACPVHAALTATGKPLVGTEADVKFAAGLAEARARAEIPAPEPFDPDRIVNDWRG